jgi:excisionase family DNA binding protein
MTEIKTFEIYTTSEAERLLKVSNSTLKRLLKKGVIRANKLGGHYRILGRELLRIVSPDVENKVASAYRQLKTKTKQKIKDW